MRVKWKSNSRLKQFEDVAENIEGEAKIYGDLIHLAFSGRKNLLIRSEVILKTVFKSYACNQSSFFCMTNMFNSYC